MAAESSESEEPWTYSRVDTEIKLLDKHYEAAQEVARRKHQLDADEARKGMQDAARAWSARGDVPQDARDMLFNLLQENLHHALELLDHSLETTIRDLKQGKDRESTKAWTKLAPVTVRIHPSFIHIHSCLHTDPFRLVEEFPAFLNLYQCRHCRRRFCRRRLSRCSPKGRHEGHGRCSQPCCTHRPGPACPSRPRVGCLNGGGSPG